MDNKDIISAKLNKKLESAQNGRKFLVTLEQDKKIVEDTFCILFPEKNSVLNKSVISNLENFFNKHNIKNALLFIVDEEIIPLLRQADLINYCNYIQIDHKTADDIMNFYMLQEFNLDFIIVSLDLPVGRNGKKLMNLFGFTMDDVAKDGILVMRSAWGT